jgi:hypothetical protein
MIRFESRHTLQEMVEQTEHLNQVRKSDLHSGDWVLVTTRNSVYSICVLGNEQYSVSGGWFDRKGVSPLRTTINGCTWGGSVIKNDIVAAPGLYLEFGNRVVTTQIQKVRVIRGSKQRVPN